MPTKCAISKRPSADRTAIICSLVALNTLNEQAVCGMPNVCCFFNEFASCMNERNGFCFFQFHDEDINIVDMRHARERISILLFAISPASPVHLFLFMLILAFLYLFRILPVQARSRHLNYKSMLERGARASFSDIQMCAVENY